MATARSARTQAMNTVEALTDIRGRLESLMNRQAAPSLVEAGGQADFAIRAAADVVRDQADAIAGRVRTRPIRSIITATALGFVLGRVLR
jgi:ElaB/YqjD/DUF883 family membrane-anchored ribosome-binding protein